MRERAGDVQLLAGYFVEQTKRKLGLNQLKITEQAITHLMQYDWPGNVRELEHVVSRSALKAHARQQGKAIISIELVDCDVLVSNDNKPVSEQLLATDKASKTASRETLALKTATENFQRQLINQVLKEEQGNWAAAARRLSTDRANLNRIAKRLNIKVVKSIV